MNTQLQSKEQKKSVHLPVDTNNEVFNFEMWAKAVRPRLIAAIQKRNTKLHKS